MNRAARLEPLADYAGKVENEAARRARRERAGAARPRRRRSSNCAAISPSTGSARSSTDATTDPLRWQNTRAFLAKLSDVVARAKRSSRKPSSATGSRPSAGAIRIGARSRSTRSSRMRRAKSRLRTAKREQRELDERALRQRRSSGDDGAWHSSCNEPCVTDSHRSAGCMEFLTSLPADLAAIADPSARGAAPLLRPPDRPADRGRRDAVRAAASRS